MARPKNDQPTPAELDVLKILWDAGELTVRDVMNQLNEQYKKQRAYTSIMSLMNVMADKKLLTRKPQGRAFLYSAKQPQQNTLGGMVTDLCQRAFAGSTSTLVSHLLEGANPTEAELENIRIAIESYQRENSQKEQGEEK